MEGKYTPVVQKLKENKGKITIKTADVACETLFSGGKIKVFKVFNSKPEVIVSGHEVDGILQEISNVLKDFGISSRIKIKSNGNATDYLNIPDDCPQTIIVPATIIEPESETQVIKDLIKEINEELTKPDIENPEIIKPELTKEQEK